MSRVSNDSREIGSPDSAYQPSEPPRMSTFCKLSVNRDQQDICRGCQKVQGLFEYRRNNKKFSAIGCQFHENFAELQTCAMRCYCCRVLLRALLLSQITTLDVENIKTLPTPHQIWACLKGDVLIVQIGSSDQAHVSAKVGYIATNSAGYVNLPLYTEQAIDEAKKWFDECHNKHAKTCDSLGWSSKNPTRLVRLLPGGTKVQIIETKSMKLVRYVALSYSWGDTTTKDPKEKEEIRSIKDLKNMNVPFPLSKLPATVQDTLRVAAILGVEYIWIDALCIKTTATTDWNYEAARMHEVYGNACVTLCACSSKKSIDGLFKPRNAWKYPSEPCRLDRYWLVNFDNTLEEIRSKADLFSRAWTLQEERLSPRIMYLCGQRLYWSCSGFQHSERGNRRGTIPPRRTPYEAPSARQEMRHPQAFLRSRHEGKEKLLQQQWLELVEDYIRRDLSCSKDRFDAISGLAAQYLVPFCVDKEVKDQEYLAGLWRLTFAQDLTWSVESAAKYEENLRNVVPASWSWASLPLRTIIKFQDDFTPNSDFTLMEGSRLGQRDQSDDVLSVVQRGSKVTSVKTRGQMRRFFHNDSRRLDWSVIENPNFSSYRDESVHSINDTDGRIMAQEPHMQGITGQLDYLPTDDRNIYCLNLGQSAMLLLVYAGSVAEGEATLKSYRRIGISKNFSENFFAHSRARIETFVLV